jgi:hypothetical protein
MQGNKTFGEERFHRSVRGRVLTYLPDIPDSLGGHSSQLSRNREKILG